MKNNNKRYIIKFGILFSLITIVIAITYAVDGDLGSDFGDKGIAITEVSDKLNRANSIVADSENNVISAGVNNVDIVGGTSGEFALARYKNIPAIEFDDLTPRRGLGQLDPSFNPNGPIPGIVISKIQEISQINSVTVDSDNRIIVGGLSRASNASPAKATIARYTFSGELDTTFNPNGEIPGVVILKRYDLSIINDIVMSTQDDGIYAVGSAGPIGFQKSTILKYTTDGQLDNSFADGGILRNTSNDNIIDEITAIKIDHQNRLVIVGNFSYTNNPNVQITVISRFLSNGVLDESLNSKYQYPGLIFVDTTDPTITESIASDLAIDSEDNILITGIAKIYNLNPMVNIRRALIVKYTADGVKDATFNAKSSNPGLLLIPITVNNKQTESDIPNDISIDNSDRIYINGYTKIGNPTSNQRDIFTARYNSNGQLDETYNYYNDIIDITVNNNVPVNNNIDNIVKINRTNGVLPKGIWIYRFKNKSTEARGATIDVFQRLITTGDIYDGTINYNPVPPSNGNPSTLNFLTMRYLFDERLSGNDWLMLNEQEVLHNPRVPTIQNLPRVIPRSQQEITVNGTTRYKDQTVNLLLNNKKVSSTTSNEFGKWQITIPRLQSLSSGQHKLEIVLPSFFPGTIVGSNTEYFRIKNEPLNIDKANNKKFSNNINTSLIPIDKSVLGKSLNKSVNLSENNKKNLNLKAQNLKITAPRDKSKIHTQEPNISGVSRPKSRITILANDRPIGTVISDKFGNWNYKVNSNFKFLPGQVYKIKAKIKDYITPSIDVVVGKQIAQEIINQSIKNNKPGPNYIHLTGKANPNSALTITFNGQPIGNTQASAKGDWSYIIDKSNLTLNIYNVVNTIKVLSTDDSGNVSSILSRTIKA